MADVAAAQHAEPPGWTPKLVGERLIAAFKALPGIPVFSIAPDHLVGIRDGAAPALDLIAATARHLGPNSEARVKLLVWARARATRASIAEICREKGWPRNSFERTWRKALATVSAGLAREGAPLT